MKNGLTKSIAMRDAEIAHLTAELAKARRDADAPNDVSILRNMYHGLLDSSNEYQRLYFETKTQRDALTAENAALRRQVEKAERSESLVKDILQTTTDSASRVMTERNASPKECGC